MRKHKKGKQKKNGKLQKPPHLPSPPKKITTFADNTIYKHKNVVFITKQQKKSKTKMWVLTKSEAKSTDKSFVTNNNGN